MLSNQLSWLGSVVILLYFIPSMNFANILAYSKFVSSHIKLESTTFDPIKSRSPDFRTPLS